MAALIWHFTWWSVMPELQIDPKCARYPFLAGNGTGRIWPPALIWFRLSRQNGIQHSRTAKFRFRPEAVIVDPR